MPDQNHIEDLFRDKFSNFEVEPSGGTWTGISKKLAWQEFFRFSLTSFNIWYAAAGLGIIGALVYVGLETSEPDVADPVEKEVPEEVIPFGEPEVEDDTLEIGVIDDPAAEESVEIDTEVPGTDPVVPMQVLPADSPAVSDLPLQPAQPADKVVGPVDEAVDLFAAEEDVIIPLADFGATPESGCHNLRVQFTDRSVNAASYRWSFGDGGFSTSMHPVYFYDQPGTYTVTLEVESERGLKDVAEQQITVYPKPEALFEVRADEDAGYGRTVYFFNYSRNAESYIWDFGDGNNSTAKDPVHVYLEPGNFTVSLTAVSEHGCTDIMELENIFSDEEYFISFPNAFRPDMGGPSDGRYDPADPVTKVFYPKYKGVSEYQLSIYNKSGLLLFETTNIEIGWNGYFNNRLVAPEVYIWKARGRFANGQPFVMAGDVTVIPNN
ncbi:MAG: PKD domain-containing protein [Marinilabiliales bacterium]|nr:MAG: PKD domain-containing protein [Marinilabiliales bacterium]